MTTKELKQEFGNIQLGIDTEENPVYLSGDELEQCVKIAEAHAEQKLEWYIDINKKYLDENKTLKQEIKELRELLVDMSKHCEGFEFRIKQALNKEQ